MAAMSGSRAALEVEWEKVLGALGGSLDLVEHGLRQLLKQEEKRRAEKA